MLLFSTLTPSVFSMSENELFVKISKSFELPFETTPFKIESPQTTIDLLFFHKNMLAFFHVLC